MCTVCIHCRSAVDILMFQWLLVLFLLVAYGLTGLSRGGQQVSRCKEVFGKAVKLLVDLASLQVFREYCYCIQY